jgi:hypothetical protein
MGGGGRGSMGTPLGIVLLTFLISGFSFLPCTVCRGVGGGERGPNVIFEKIGN